MAPFMAIARLDMFANSLNGVFDSNLNPSLIEGAAMGEAAAMDKVRVTDDAVVLTCECAQAMKRCCAHSF